MMPVDKMVFDLEKYSSNVACISEEGDIFTYRDLKSYCDLFIGSVKRRCIILILCEKKVDCLIGYISSLNNRVVPLLVDAKTDKCLLNRYIENYHPDYIYGPKGCEFPFYAVRKEIHSYCLLESDSVFQSPKINDDIALLLPTSGSTGSQKLVKQSYKNIISNTNSILDYLPITEKDRTVTTLPLNYTYGLSVINTHISAGASILFTDKTVIQSDFWKLFERYQITTFHGVPFIYEMLRKLNFSKKDYFHLRIMTQAGGHLDNKLQEYYAQYCLSKDIKFFVMYGQTEATARISYLPPENALTKIGSIGLAIPGGRLFLRDKNGEEIDSFHKEGELMYEGDNVTLGYADSLNDLFEEPNNNNILATGDIAYRDEDGFYFICGRKSRFLKIYGKRIGLAEVEILLNEKFVESKFFCAGSDDFLLVYVKGTEDVESVIGYIEKNIGINRRSIKVRYLKEIPMTLSGKVMYSKLDEHILDNDSNCLN